jgi:cellulose synthase/poly-beta-1,6-N-acetylglucosamine synthase-like glycosyltransferase
VTARLALAWQLLSLGYWLYATWAGERTLRALARLDAIPVSAPVPWPRVSLIVPARDEAGGIAAAVQSRLEDDYPDLEVRAIDDRSSDGTGAILDRLAARDRRLSVQHVHDLPAGWLGKVHAQALGAAGASGAWLLFSDADVHFAPGTLRRAVSLAEERGLDMLSVAPEVGGASFAMQIALGAFGRSFALSRRFWSVADPRSSAHAGVGAFNLVRRAAFLRTPGFEWLRLDVADDVALGLLMKRSGARCAVAQGAGCVTVSWYRDLPHMARGLEKNTFAVLGCSLLRCVVLAALWLLMELGAWVALLGPGPGGLRAVAAAVLLLALWSTARSARAARASVAAALLVPVGTLILAWIVVRAGWLGWRRGGIQWRGTFHSASELRAGRRVGPLG